MSKREKEIRIMVSTQEYENIKQMAKEAGIQVSPYIRRVAQNPTIYHFDFMVLIRHAEMLGEIRNSINRLIFTIYATNNYLPREIETIVNLMQEVFNTENEIHKIICDLDEELTRKALKL